MEEYEAFSAALKNLRELYNYDEPYEIIVLAGFSVLYRECFGRSLKLMGVLMEKEGYPEKDTEYPRQVLKAAYQRGLIKELDLWFKALELTGRIEWDSGRADMLEYVADVKRCYFPLFCELQDEAVRNWLSRYEK